MPNETPGRVAKDRSQGSTRAGLGYQSGRSQSICRYRTLGETLARPARHRKTRLIEPDYEHQKRCDEASSRSKAKVERPATLNRLRPVPDKALYSWRVRSIG